MSRHRVVILGGGMAGLTAAWELSRGDWRREFESITVYQRGWRLGGKGASSRGPNGRIEEHGLHILLGYYDTTFGVLREVYAELDRARTDPACPLRAWRDALVPSGDVGLADWDGRSWGHFVTRFSTDSALPGEPGAADRPLDPLQIAVRSLRLLWDFLRSVTPEPEERVYLSGSPDPRNGTQAQALVRGAALTAVAVALEVVGQAERRLAPEAATSLARALDAWHGVLHSSVQSDPAARRTWQLVDLVVANLRGMLADGLLSGDGFEDIDHLDYREWLAGHGADPQTVESAVIRGMYDLTFAYEGGDRARPRFSAGLGLQLAARMLFDHKGSIFWRMQAGMGEVVFAPLHQALSARGVDFRFFHRLDRLEVGDDSTISAIHLTRQADLEPGLDRYDPLVRVGGLPCWPDRPLTDQLTTDPGDLLESHAWSGAGTPETLVAGRDFDAAVLAVSLGMVPHVAADVIDAAPAWRRMVDNVATVATRSAQLWLDATTRDLGWDGPAGVTLSGFGADLDTWADMSHLLPSESWPGDEPSGLAYFCSAMSDDAEAVGTTVARFLDEQVGALWPAAQGPEGFRWDLLHDDRARQGQERLAAQYLRANTDPSDRYVQSLPGTGRHRIPPGDTGFTNLFVAGDWTACGLDAGCLEAATRSGVLASAAVRDARP